MRTLRSGCCADWARVCASWSRSKSCWLNAWTARTRYASEKTIARGSTDRRSACIGRDRLWHGAHRGLRDPVRGREGAARPAGLGRDRAFARAMGPCEDAGRAQPGRVRRADRPLRRCRTVSQHRRHGALPVRYRRVPILLPAATAPGRSAAPPCLSAARRDRQSVGGRALEDPARTPADARRASRGLPAARPDQAHAAPAALRDRRLQLPAPGHLRRRRVSPAGHVLPEPAGRRLHGRRLPAGRAAAAGPVAGRGDRHRAGRDRHLRDAPPTGRGGAGRLSRRHAPWREPHHLGVALHAGRHLPRRPLAHTITTLPSSAVSTSSASRRWSMSSFMWVTMSRGQSSLARWRSRVARSRWNRTVLSKKYASAMKRSAPRAASIRLSVHSVSPEYATILSSPATRSAKGGAPLAWTTPNGVTEIEPSGNVTRSASWVKRRRTASRSAMSPGRTLP